MQTRSKRQKIETSFHPILEEIFKIDECLNRAKEYFNPDTFDSALLAYKGIWPEDPLLSTLFANWKMLYDTYTQEEQTIILIENILLNFITDESIKNGQILFNSAKCSLYKREKEQDGEQFDGIGFTATPIGDVFLFSYLFNSWKRYFKNEMADIPIMLPAFVYTRDELKEKVILKSNLYVIFQIQRLYYIITGIHLPILVEWGILNVHSAKIIMSFNNQQKRWKGFVFETAKFGTDYYITETVQFIDVFYSDQELTKYLFQTDRTIDYVVWSQNVQTGDSCFWTSFVMALFCVLKGFKKVEHNIGKASLYFASWKIIFIYNKWLVHLCKLATGNQESSLNILMQLDIDHVSLKTITNQQLSAVLESARQKMNTWIGKCAKKTYPKRAKELSSLFETIEKLEEEPNNKMKLIYEQTKDKYKTFSFFDEDQKNTDYNENSDTDKVPRRYPITKDPKNMSKNCIIL